MPRNLKLFESAAGDSDGEDAGERNATTSTSTNGEGDTVVGSVSASGTGYDDDDEVCSCLPVLHVDTESASLCRV
jgi:hypothetical protein